jgi:hypothetical protein
MRQAIGSGLRFFQRESVAQDSRRSVVVLSADAIFPTHGKFSHPSVHAIGVAAFKPR